MVEEVADGALEHVAAVLGRPSRCVTSDGLYQSNLLVDLRYPNIYTCIDW